MPLQHDVALNVATSSCLGEFQFDILQRPPHGDLSLRRCDSTFARRQQNVGASPYFSHLFTSFEFFMLLLMSDLHFFELLLELIEALLGFRGSLLRQFDVVVSWGKVGMIEDDDSRWKRLLLIEAGVVS